MFCAVKLHTTESMLARHVFIFIHLNFVLSLARLPRYFLSDSGIGLSVAYETGFIDLLRC